MIGLRKLLLFKAFFTLHCVAPSSLDGLHDRVLVSAVTRFFGGSYVVLPSQRWDVKFFHVGLRVSWFVHALVIWLIFKEVLNDRSASVFQVIFCSLEVLRFFQISRCDGSFGYFSMLNHQQPGTQVMNRLLIRCSVLLLHLFCNAL